MCVRVGVNYWSRRFGVYYAFVLGRISGSNCAKGGYYWLSYCLYGVDNVVGVFGLFFLGWS